MFVIVDVELRHLLDITMRILKIAIYKVKYQERHFVIFVKYLVLNMLSDRANRSEQDNNSSGRVISTNNKKLNVFIGFFVIFYCLSPLCELWDFWECVHRFDLARVRCCRILGECPLKFVDLCIMSRRWFSLYIHSQMMVQNRITVILYLF